jgi:hypothetical protein
MHGWLSYPCPLSCVYESGLANFDQGFSASEESQGIAVPHGIRAEVVLRAHECDPVFLISTSAKTFSFTTSGSFSILPSLPDPINTIN